MFSLFSTLKITNTKHVVCAELENNKLAPLIQEALESWHDEDNEPRMKYIVDNSDDQVQCTLLGARGSNFVVVSFRDGSYARYKIIRAVHNGKVIQQTIKDVTADGPFPGKTDAEVALCHA